MVFRFHQIHLSTGVSLLDTEIPVSSITGKDWADLKAGLDAGMDRVAVSFVGRPDDVAEVMKLTLGRALVMSKLEKPQAIARPDAIVEMSDALEHVSKKLRDFFEFDMLNHFDFERFLFDHAILRAGQARLSMVTINGENQADMAADTSLPLLPTVPKIQQCSPPEEITLIPDEAANMMRGIETTILLATGETKRGAEAGRVTLAFYRNKFPGCWM